MVKYEKYQTKSGKEFWKYYGYLGLDPKTGKKLKPRAQGFTSKAAAKLAYERVEQSFKEDQSLNVQIAKTFYQVYEEFMVYYEESGVKPGTLKKFNDEMIKHALPLLGDLYIDKIDVQDCQESFNKIRKKRKDHMKIKNQIERIIDFAINRQYITMNPMRYILISKVNVRYKKRRLSTSENFYTPMQLLDFLDAFKEVEEFHKFVFFRILAFTGLRRGEALALYESDFLKSEKALNINKTLAEDDKGKTYLSFMPKTEESTSLVYLDDETFDYIDTLIKRRNEFDTYGDISYIHNNKFLFPSPKTNSHYGRSAANDWLRNFFSRNIDELKKRGLHRISPHGLRHSQATLLFELGIDPKDAQHRLRHKNLKTTMDTYTHLTEQRKKASVHKLDEFSSTRKTTLNIDEQKPSEL